METSAGGVGGSGGSGGVGRVVGGGSGICRRTDCVRHPPNVSYRTCDKQISPAEHDNADDHGMQGRHQPSPSQHQPRDKVQQ